MDKSMLDYLARTGNGQRVFSCLEGILEADRAV